MAVIADLMARLGVDTTDFQAGMSKVDSMMRNAQGASTALLAGVAVAAAGMAAFGVKSIIAAGQLEQTTVAFTTMLGSAERSTALLKELQTFAATTPFEFTEITAASKKLLAFGVNAEDITSTLRSLGDVSSGIGAPIGEIAELYGKAKTQGRLFAEDINQLTGRGIPIIAELAKQFNVSESEIRGLVESGKVGFPNLQLAFENMTAAGAQFGGLMEAQSKTLPGMWSNLMDAIGQSSVVLGQELIKTFDLKDKLAGVIEGLSQITALLQSEGLMGALDKIFNERTQLAIVTISGAIVAALIPALWGLVVAIGAGVIALAPFIVIGTAVSALAYTIYKNWEPISAFFTNTWTAISTFLATTWTSISTNATGIFNAIVAFFTNTWNGITSKVTNVWNGIANFFTTTWTSILTGIMTAWNAIPIFFTGLWNSIKNTFVDVINGIVTFVTATFGKQINDVYVIFLALGRIFTGVWEIYKNIFLGAILLIIDLVTGNFTKLKEDAANIFDSLGMYFSDIWGNIKLIFTRALDLITTTLTQAWNGIVGGATTAWSELGYFFVGLWDGITNIAINAWNGLKDAVSSIMSSTVSEGINIFNGILDFFWNLPGTLYNLGVDAFNGLIYGVSDILSGLWWAVSSGFNDAISFITNLPGQAWQWGADIIGGIVQGIKDAAWAVGNAVSGVAQTIRNFLHFSVPDEGPLVDFQSWMPDFMGGLAEGITNSKYLVTNAMKGLSTDMSIGVNTNVVSGKISGNAAGNAGNAGSGRPQSINVIVELDSRTLLKALGQPLADTIRLKASAIF